ncbi:2OG-Fe(II) oxygenase [Novosphingobium panipatense]|jgi:prolyl 4-hydroxylase|uniref:2OG-Fe(II) oxygenase n=1 Tax=Novosphingobium TaxID=165696 RepID=UPI000CDA2504|nr:2OG-Fe(II) oxygenase [Novosphingobium sp. HII-3]
MTQARDRAQAALDNGRHQDAVAIAEDAAARGDGECLSLLARWRLIGRPLPRDLPEARRLLRQATLSGNADAALTEAALTANGTGARPDWQGAVKILKEAADLHGGVATQDLALLSRMDLDEAGYPRQMPEPERMGEGYQVKRWRQFLTPEECAHLAMSVHDLLAPSTVADPRTGRLRPHPVRTSSAAVVGPTRETLPLQALMRRIAQATETGVEQGEPLNVLHYAPGQQYLPHMDTLPHVSNQRIVTALAYLNTGYIGGETCFPEQNLSIAGGGGDLVAFANTLPDGSPDTRSRHASAPVRQGAKWAATRWIRAKPFDVWTQSSA